MCARVHACARALACMHVCVCPYARVCVPGGHCPPAASVQLRPLCGLRLRGPFLRSPYRWPQPWQQDLMSTNFPHFLDLVLQTFLSPLSLRNWSPHSLGLLGEGTFPHFQWLTFLLGSMPHFFRIPKALCPHICPLFFQHLLSLYTHWLPFSFPISINFLVNFSVSKA